MSESSPESCKYFRVAGMGITHFAACSEGPARHGCVACCMYCGLRLEHKVKGSVGEHIVLACKTACKGPEI